MKVEVKVAEFPVVFVFVKPVGSEDAVDPFDNCHNMLLDVDLLEVHKPATAVVLDKGTNIVVPEEDPDVQAKVEAAAFATGIATNVVIGTSRVANKIATSRCAVRARHEVLASCKPNCERNPSSYSGMGNSFN